MRNCFPKKDERFPTHSCLLFTWNKLKSICAWQHLRRHKKFAMTASQCHHPVSLESPPSLLILNIISKLSEPHQQSQLPPSSLKSSKIWGYEAMKYCGGSALALEIITWHDASWIISSLASIQILWDILWYTGTGVIQTVYLTFCGCQLPSHPHKMTLLSNVSVSGQHSITKTFSLINTASIVYYFRTSSF